MKLLSLFLTIQLKIRGRTKRGERKNRILGEIHDTMDLHISGTVMVMVMAQPHLDDPMVMAMGMV